MNVRVGLPNPGARYAPSLEPAFEIDGWRKAIGAVSTFEPAEAKR